MTQEQFLSGIKLFQNSNFSWTLIAKQKLSYYLPISRRRRDGFKYFSKASERSVTQITSFRITFPTAITVTLSTPLTRMKWMICTKSLKVEYNQSILTEKKLPIWSKDAFVSFKVFFLGSRTIISASLTVFRTIYSYLSISLSPTQYEIFSLSIVVLALGKAKICTELDLVCVKRLAWPSWYLCVCVCVCVCVRWFTKIKWNNQEQKKKKKPWNIYNRSILILLIYAYIILKLL